MPGETRGWETDEVRLTGPNALDRPLWWRIVVVNVLVFIGGTAVLAFGPQVIDREPLLSEGAVLAIGLVLMAVANALVVRSMLRPLDRLVDRLGREWAADPSQRLPLPSDQVAARLTESVNGLLARIEAGQLEAGAAALAAQESERARIAQELHDGVGQSLTAILLEAGRLADSDRVSGEDVARIRDITRDALTEVRSVARRLRPHVLEDLGLRSALAALTQDLFSRGPTHAVRRIDAGELGLDGLDEGIEVVVFRVAQEALTNVARHADARTVEVELTRTATELRLTVSDDGRGLPAGAQGTGLRGIAERAALVGGRAEVARRPEGGTRVELVVPLSGAASIQAGHGSEDGNEPGRVG